MEAAAEMKNRFNETVFPNRKLFENNPNLILNPEKTDFYDFTIEDFTMENYQPLKPQLKLELGI